MVEIIQRECSRKLGAGEEALVKSHNLVLVCLVTKSRKEKLERSGGTLVLQSCALLMSCVLLGRPGTVCTQPHSTILQDLPFLGSPPCSQVPAVAPMESHVQWPTHMLCHSAPHCELSRAGFYYYLELLLHLPLKLFFTRMLVSEKQGLYFIQLLVPV